MELIKSKIKDCVLLIPKVFEDHRGNFYESYNKNLFKELGLNYNFVQDNESFNKKRGTIRGFHFQINKSRQAKLIHCSKGAILGVIADMRKGSPTYGEYVSYEISEDNHYQILVPRGCAWGFQTLRDNTVVNYKLDNFYDGALERGINYLDPTLNVKWPIKNITISDKDKNQPFLDNIIESILITGFTGQLGHDIYNVIKKKYPTKSIYVPTEEELDITNSKDVSKYVIKIKPDLIIHCAAYTNVEKAEEDKKTCYNVNVIGTRNIAKASLRCKAKIIYFSTDYVYDGKKKTPYVETNTPNPLNYYGLTKLLGEKEIKKNKKHFIIRTSWLFGTNGKNFIKSMIKLSETKEALDIVNDQIGSPTYTLDLAHVVSNMIARNNYGTYHITNGGYCSWNQLAKYVFNVLKINTLVNKISTKDYKEKVKQKANRPLNSKMSKNKLKKEGYVLLPNWQDAVNRFLNEK